MTDRCPTCDQQIESNEASHSAPGNIYQSLFRARRPLRDAISQTISLFGGIAVGVVIGRGSAETTRTLIMGCIGFALFSIVIQTISHKWIYRRQI